MKEIKSKRNNPFKKVFIKICRFFGVELIDQSSFSIPTSSKSINEALSTPGKNSIVLPMGKISITRPVKSLNIILRTCMSVNMLTQSKKRIFEKDKEEYTKKTLKSIIKSVNYAKSIFKEIKFKIHVIDHNSSKEQFDNIKVILEKSNLDFEILNLKFNEFSNLIENINEEKKEVTDNQKSNMSNIHQSLDIAKNCEDLIYFVEDDYLHTRGSILELLLTYEKFSSQLNSELFLCPADYPYLYRDIENTNILLGDKSHWRKINQSLCTFMTSRKMIDKYYEKLTKMCTFEHYPFEKPLHDIFRSELCFSPIPSIANHCTNINSVYGISPNVDLKNLWEECEPKN